MFKVIQLVSSRAAVFLHVCHSKGQVLSSYAIQQKGPFHHMGQAGATLGRAWVQIADTPGWMAQCWGEQLATRPWENLEYGIWRVKWAQAIGDRKLWQYILIEVLVQTETMYSRP